MQIDVLDLNFQGISQAIASYLVRGEGGAVLVETGPVSTLPTLLAHLEQHSLRPEDLAAVFVTHIHLDHAGAAGWLAQRGVPVYVHEVGAPHLIDPSRLWASASRIYGDQMERLWGSSVPASAAQVMPLGDGDEVTVAGMTLRALDTPGHATHHHAICVEDVAFTGDAAGVRLPGSAWVDVPAPPPEFDLARWQATLSRLQGERFACLYPTHFGPVAAAEEHLSLFSACLDAAAAFVRVRMDDGLSRDELVVDYVAWLERFARGLGVTPASFASYAIANPPSMSVDGLMRYWRKRQAA